MQKPLDYILVHDLLEELKLLRKHDQSRNGLSNNQPRDLIDPKDLLALIEKLRVPAM